MMAGVSSAPWMQFIKICLCSMRSAIASWPAARRTSSDGLIGMAEVWIALRFMGRPATTNEALVIESLMQAIRGAAFAVRGAFGGQEAGLILLSAYFTFRPIKHWRYH
jgi:hypothetical protein